MHKKWNEWRFCYYLILYVLEYISLYIIKRFCRRRVKKRAGLDGGGGGGGGGRIILSPPKARNFWVCSTSTILGSIPYYIYGGFQAVSTRL